MRFPAQRHPVLKTGSVMLLSLGLTVLPAMDVLAADPFADVKWTTVAHATLDEKDDATLCLFNPDAGVKTKVSGGVATVVGTSEVDGFVATGIWRPIGGDDRTLVEVAVDFKVGDTQAASVVLRLPSSAGLWCMVYYGGYYAHPVHFAVPFTVKHFKEPSFKFGDETRVFHSMRMVLNRATMELSYFADDVLLSVVQFETQVEPINFIQANVETFGGRGMPVDASFDNLRVRVAGPRQPVKRST